MDLWDAGVRARRWTPPGANGGAGGWAWWRIAKREERILLLRWGNGTGFGRVRARGCGGRLRRQCWRRDVEATGGRRDVAATGGRRDWQCCRWKVRSKHGAHMGGSREVETAAGWQPGSGQVGFGRAQCLERARGLDIGGLGAWWPGLLQCWDRGRAVDSRDSRIAGVNWVGVDRVSWVVSWLPGDPHTPNS